MSSIAGSWSSFDEDVVLRITHRGMKLNYIFVHEASSLGGTLENIASRRAPETECEVYVFLSSVWGLSISPRPFMIFGSDCYVSRFASGDDVQLVSYLVPEEIFRTSLDTLSSTDNERDFAANLLNTEYNRLYDEHQRRLENQCRLELISIFQTPKPEGAVELLLVTDPRL